MRLRLRYAKLGKVRFTGHRDTARIWERALRTGGIPVVLSAGFTPRPRLSFGLALPTGAESVAEYLDADVDAQRFAADDLDGGALADRLSAALPDGFTVLAAAVVEPGGSLQETVTSVTWELTAPADTDVSAVAARLLDAAALPLARVRKGHDRLDDVRPDIVALRSGADRRGDQLLRPPGFGCGAAETQAATGVTGDRSARVHCANRSTLVADVATTGRGLRPAELAALAFPDAEALGIRARRTHQWIDHDGRRREVMTLDDAVRLASLGADQVVVPAGSAGA